MSPRVEGTHCPSPVGTHGADRVSPNDMRPPPADRTVTHCGLPTRDALPGARWLPHISLRQSQAGRHSAKPAWIPEPRKSMEGSRLREPKRHRKAQTRQSTPTLTAAFFGKPRRANEPSVHRQSNGQADVVRPRRGTWLSPRRWKPTRCSVKEDTALRESSRTQRDKRHSIGPREAPGPWDPQTPGRELLSGRDQFPTCLRTSPGGGQWPVTWHH